MTAAIVKWATRQFGHRFTATTDTLSVDVCAWTDEATEGGIASATFTINGNPTVVSAAAMRLPNYNRVHSPRTGTSKMRRVAAWGLDVNAADYAVGAITITAKVTSTLGTDTNLPGNLVIYNDKDGSDSRPEPNTIYVDADNGNNLNAGTTRAAPVLSILRAVELASGDPDGNDNQDVGGATVVLMTSRADHEWCRSYSIGPNIYTSLNWWLTINVEIGARITRTGVFDGSSGPVYTPADHDFNLRGFFDGADWGGAIRVLMVGLENRPIKQLSRGDLKIRTETGVTAVYHAEGIRFGDSRHVSGTDDNANRQDILFTETGTGLWDQVNASNVTTTLEASCCTAEGVANGFVGVDMTHECEVNDWVGIAFQTASTHPGQSAINCGVGEQRYDQEVRGKVDCWIGDKVSITKVGSDTMRITRIAGQTIFAEVGGVQTTSEVDIIWHAQNMSLTADNWGWRVEGCTNAGNNSLVGFPVTGWGSTNGEPYIDLENASVVDEAVALTGATMLTAKQSAPGTFYVDAVHPDVWQLLNDMTDALIYGMDVEDATGTRIWAGSTATYTRVAWVNCGDNWTDANTDMTGTAYVNCLWFHCTFQAAFNWGTTFTDCEARKNVFQVSNSAPASGITFDGNHFITGTASGTNSTTGTWFATNPETKPFSLAPTTANQGTAPSDGLYYPESDSELGWPGGTTAGVWRDTGENHQALTAEDLGGCTGCNAKKPLIDGEEMDPVAGEANTWSKGGATDPEFFFFPSIFFDPAPGTVAGEDPFWSCSMNLWSIDVVTQKGVCAGNPCIEIDSCVYFVSITFRMETTREINQPQGNQPTAGQMNVNWPTLGGQPTTVTNSGALTIINQEISAMGNFVVVTEESFITMEYDFEPGCGITENFQLNGSIDLGVDPNLWQESVIGAEAEDGPELRCECTKCLPGGFGGAGINVEPNSLKIKLPVQSGGSF